MHDDKPQDIASTQGAASLDNVVVILSRTTEPMNIGATCRAMKTMGLKHLRLISPLNPKGRSARALAHGAEDILDRAEVVVVGGGSDVERSRGAEPASVASGSTIGKSCGGGHAKSACPRSL